MVLCCHLKTQPCSRAIQSAFIATTLLDVFHVHDNLWAQNELPSSRGDFSGRFASLAEIIWAKQNPWPSKNQYSYANAKIFTVVVFKACLQYRFGQNQSWGCQAVMGDRHWVPSPHGFPNGCALTWAEYSTKPHRQKRSFAHVTCTTFFHARNMFIGENQDCVGVNQVFYQCWSHLG